MVRMRTIPQLVKEMKLEDPETHINEHFIRRLVKQEKIPYVKADSRVYIPRDEFMEYLKNPKIFKGEVGECNIRRFM